MVNQYIWIGITLGIFLSVLQSVDAEVWIPEFGFTSFFDSSGQYTVIGSVKNTENFPVIPTITINIADGDKITSESFEHVPILPSKEIPFKFKIPEVASKSTTLLKPNISFVSSEKTPLEVEVIYDKTLAKHEDGHLTGRIINKGEFAVYNIKVFAIIHGFEKVLDVGQSIEVIEKMEPGEIHNFSMYPDVSIEDEINYYSCFAIGDTSIVTLNTKRHDEKFTIRADTGHLLSYPEFDKDGRNLSLSVLGGFPLADYVNLEFPISSLTEKFEVYFNDEPIDFVQSIDEEGTWHVAFNMVPQSRGNLLISGFEEKDETISENFTLNNLIQKSSLPSNIQITIFNPPLKQIQIGIKPTDVVCKEELQLIQSIHGKPACVKIESVEKLTDRGWALKDSFIN